MIRLLLLILCFVITSCTMDCVEPGLQNRNTTVNVDVPVHIGDDKSKIHWVDSDQVIKKGEKIKFNVSGSINFCPPKDGENPRKVLVPAGFCANGEEPNYDEAKNINNVPDNYGINESELCNGEFGHSSRRYVEAKIKVNPGDKLIFGLVPRKIKIDCDKLEKFIFDDNCYKEDGDKATAKEICKGGTFYCGNEEEKRKKKEFKPLMSDEKEQTSNDEVLVGNGYTPYDNKVHFSKEYIENDNPWVVGSLSDLRRTKVGLGELCDEERSKGGDWKTRCGLDKMKKYNSYELNCYDQNICYSQKGIWNKGLERSEGSKNCVSSIRYKNYDKGNKCDMYSHFREIEEKIKNIKEKPDSLALSTDDDSEGTKDISWAEALVAKIGDLDEQSTAKGTQCLPKYDGPQGDMVCSQNEKSSNFEDFSLKLDSEYTVNENVKPGSSVMLAIADYGYYHDNRGGYHVQVNKSCNFANGEKLYIYLGDAPPEDLSTVGTNDFKKVPDLSKENHDYIIDGSHLNEKESKKIYFGIDISDVEKDDVTNKKGEYHKDNKYSLNLSVTKKINNFFSSTVNKIFGFIIGGEEGAGSVKDLYDGYRKGLLLAVRALLTLYVIFSVVGYMLGTAQLSKHDFIIRITKIAFIAFVFSEKSWELFGKNLAMFFIGGSNYLVNSFSGYIGEDGENFAFLDITVGVLFSGETWLKFLSLMLSGPFGFIAFLIILKGTATFLKCIISAMVKYVIAIVLGGFLLSLTPLFIAFMLFQRTKGLFDGWIKILAHASVQPVILFSSLSLLNQLMYSVLYNLTNFSACYQCLISINFLDYDLCLFKSILPLGYSPGTSVDTALSSGERNGGYFAALPIDLIQAFIYLIIASAMEVFVVTSERMAQSIFKSSHGVAGSIGIVASKASQAALSTVGLDDKTQTMIRDVKRAGHKGQASIGAKAKSPSNDKTPESDAPKKEGSSEAASPKQSDTPRKGSSSETASTSDASKKQESSSKDGSESNEEN